MKTMVNCNQTRRMIDEADHPESLPFEVSRHVAACPDCGGFAEERARLRSLLISGTRVTVPVNFDAMLKSRLADAGARSSFAWLSRAGYLRLGGATAALAVMVFAVQYGGLFGRAPTGHQETAAARSAQPAVRTPAQAAPQLNPATVLAGAGAALSKSVRRGNVYSARAHGAGVPVDVSSEDYLHEDRGVMLVRGPNGEGDVSLPMVSVGAQSMVYASAGASRRPARTIGTSF